jgi:uncharacterized membrane protein
MYKAVKDFKFPIESGILPVSLFAKMFKYVKDFKFPILDGMVPFRRL